MAKPDNWMPFYLGDYLRDTTHLSMAQHGAYVLLLFAAWSRGGSLPDDDRSLSLMARATAAEWKRVRPVIAEFFTIKDGEWRQKRLSEELERATALREKAAEKAKGAASKRWGRDAPSNAPSNAPSMPQAMPEAMLEQCPTPIPLPNTSLSDTSTPYAGPQGGQIGGGELIAGNLTRGTWEAWKRHLSQKGKPMTPIAEQHNLARMPAMFADLESVVQNSLANGWMNLHATTEKPKSRNASLNDTAAAIMGAVGHGPDTSCNPTDITAESVRVA